jgi:hypothetical protein
LSAFNRLSGKAGPGSAGRALCLGMDDPDDGKVIVTHKKPHLDEVVAIWLLRRFDPEFKVCQYQFIPYFSQMPAGPQYVGVGYGGGKYDEHQIKTNHTSATKLVHDDLCQRGLIPDDGWTPEALDILVGYSDRVDRGLTMVEDNEGWPFSPPSIIRSHIERTKDDRDALRFGLELIDNIMTELVDQAKFKADWAKRIKFDTPWGPGAGIESDFLFSDTYAYTHGYIARIQKHLSESIVSIKVNPTKDIDLTPVYEKLIALEPDSWYLHQAKKMVISNIDPSTDRQPSKLTLHQLIDLVTK